MTLAEIKDLASACLTATTVDERAAFGLALAQGFMARFGESQPCGWEAPEADGGEIDIPEQWTTYMVRSLVMPDDADAMARLLLAAADKARTGGSDE